MDTSAEREVHEVQSEDDYTNRTIDPSLYVYRLCKYVSMRDQRRSSPYYDRREVHE